MSNQNLNIFVILVVLFFNIIFFVSAQKNLKLSQPQLFKVVANDTAVFTVDVPETYHGISISVYCENQCQNSFYFNVSRASDSSVHWSHQDSSGVPTFLLTSKNSPPFSPGKYVLGVKSSVTSKVSLVVVGYQAGQSSLETKPLVHRSPNSGRYAVIFKTPQLGSDILSFKMFADKKQIDSSHRWTPEKLVAQGMLSTLQEFSEIDVDPALAKQRDTFEFFIRVKDHVYEKVTQLYSTEVIFSNN